MTEYTITFTKREWDEVKSVLMQHLTERNYGYVTHGRSARKKVKEAKPND